MTTATADTTTANGTAEPTKFEQIRARYPWLDHLVRAGARYTEKHGDHYAAAITYFSILALVPLLMIAFAAAAFVLVNNQALLDPDPDQHHGGRAAGLGDLLNKVIEQAIAQRNAVGIIGLLGALYSGLGWMGNLREALSEQWDQRDDPPPVVKRYARRPRRHDRSRASRSRCPSRSPASPPAPRTPSRGSSASRARSGCRCS